MDKTTLEFRAVPYQVGSGAAAITGYRPQMEPLQAVRDETLCQEVVDGVRLSTSAKQLLHDIRSFIKACLEKTCADGRPRYITGADGKVLFKFAPLCNGNLESPSSAWNDTCKAYVRPQFLCDAKTIDANFRNVDSGIGVKLDNVTYQGAQTVINVIKTNTAINAFGRHMEFDATAGDTAYLLLADGTAKALTCTASDVAHATFSWPTGYAPEAGTVVTFVMKSRGGVEGGEVYTSKKTVTVVG